MVELTLCLRSPAKKPKRRVEPRRFRLQKKMKSINSTIPGITDDGNGRAPKVTLHRNGRFSVRLHKHWQRELDRLELPVYRQLPSSLRRQVVRHLVKHEV